MTKKHKWHEEIIAWANGAEIEEKYVGGMCMKDWTAQNSPAWHTEIGYVYRIKQQPKEPQYLYAYKVNAKIVELYDELQMGWDGKMLLGKIKLEWDND
jgi:hypothetical protein